MNKYLIKLSFLCGGLLAFLGLAVYLTSTGNIEAQAQIPVVFPLCESQTEDGDRAHYDTGLHQIAGDGLLEGRDDVYSLEGVGIQTNWTPDEAGSEPGLEWGLNDVNYNYENINYYCGSVIPTTTPAIIRENSIGEASPPVCNDTVPSAPRILSVTSAGTNSVKITWTKVTQANSYSISYGRETGEYLYSVFSTGDTDNFVINGISSGCFVVKAVNGCMPGPLSAEYCTGGSVLGASTLASTGGFTDSINNLILIFGSTLIALGLTKLAKKRFFSNSFASEASNLFTQDLITDNLFTNWTALALETFTLGVERATTFLNYLISSSYTDINGFKDKNSFQKSKIFV